MLRRGGRAEQKITDEHAAKNYRNADPGSDQTDHRNADHAGDQTE